MQTILIPTDFNPELLSRIPSLFDRMNAAQDVQLLFVHQFKISDSITDLLSLSRRNRDYEHISDEFYAGVQRLRRLYPALPQPKIDFMYGSTLSVFKNYLEANEVTHVLEIVGLESRPLSKASVDTSVLIKRAGLPVIHLPQATAKPVQQEKQSSKVREEASAFSSLV
jgi:hypothetical protein